ncbi:MAG: aminotransferase class V-fold PLP-dependent enzyme, partial [Balneolaceae bacterium]|nr:aminotransferase class V-fold PLP-dependent enzyme [Balneolaceae bacterium]
SWLSSFDLRKKNKVITTDGEFHSLFRQLHRLEEEGLELVMVEAASDRIVEQIEQSIDDNTAAIMLSRVYFRSALINDHIPHIVKLARNHRIPFLIDDYHGTNVVPLSIREAGLDDCYLLIGGYKYLQWGEGNCFLRFPDNCKLRPAVTGWFASFNTLDNPRTEKEPVAYDEGDQRFASGTYDSVSQFRAVRVVDFFRKQELTPQRLATQYRRQVGLMRELFVQQQFDKKVIGLHSGVPLHRIGGFLSLRSESAPELHERLLEKGVWTDARGEILRMGPAPYITTRQIEQAMERLSEVIREISP